MNFKHIGKLLAVGALLLLWVGWAPGALANLTANGTEAGTEITNDATLDFSVATIAQDQISTADPDQLGTATFLVDRVLNVNVTVNDAEEVNVTPGETNAKLSFDVTNLSNDDIDILLGLSRNAANDVFRLS